MSKGSRWQPPHPDPNPVARYAETLARTGRHFDEQASRRDCQPRAICTWFDCERLSATELDVPLCMIHACAAHHDYVRVTADAQTAEQTALERSIEKVESGVPLDPNDPTPGWIYYIQIDDVIKIGYAKRISQRMRAFPPNATLLAAEPGTKKLEHVRHSLFHVHLAWGREWFHDNPELRDWIAKIIERHGDLTGLAYTYTKPDKPPIVAGKHMGRRW